MADDWELEVAALFTAVDEVVLVVTIVEPDAVADSADPAVPVAFAT